MSPYSINDERMDMLDKLNDIPLKGFQEIDATPTSAATSLPTPQEVHTSLKDHIQEPPDTPYSFLTFEEQIPMPGAPRMKDFDSFTEGTAKGSFDSIPAASTDEHGESVAPINTLSLSLLPPHDTSLSIEMWRAEVHSSGDATSTDNQEVIQASGPSTQVKRPRSTAASSDNGGRRIRARSCTVISPTPVNPSRFSFGGFSPSLSGDSRYLPPRAHSAPPD